MIVTAAEMQKLEAKAFSSGASAEALMDDAGAQIARAIMEFFPAPASALVFFGKGNNGGDALVAARYLRQGGWQVELVPAYPESALGELPRKKLAACGDGGFSLGSAPTVILDGLLGVGARGALRDPIRAATRKINRLRSQTAARVFAIDLPTGLDATTGAAAPDCVIADFTLAIGFAKTGLVVDEATNLVGRLTVLPLRDLASPKETSRNAGRVATASTLRSLLPRRNFDTHKTRSGRVGIVAGSIGFTGAAALTAAGAVRGGAGLVSLYATRETHPILAAICPPEVMVKPVHSYREIFETERDVLAIGPGLGTERREEILFLIKEMPIPMVIDADAINVLAANPKLLKSGLGPRLLTPHPGEMARLFSTTKLSRKQLAERFVGRFPVTLLLKGSRTIVAENGQPISYNSTGSPGMATGGMGDVLTGVCAALIGQRLSCFDAARVGAWVCGRAAELAITVGNCSEESLTPSDLLKFLGRAFQKLRERSV